MASKIRSPQNKQKKINMLQKAEKSPKKVKYLKSDKTFRRKIHFSHILGHNL